MSRRPPSTIKRLKWRMEWLFQVSAEFLIARLPAAVAFRAGEAMGAILWHLMPQRRRIVRKNLRIAMAGEMSRGEIDLLARRSFIRSIANLISAVHTAHLPMRVLESRVTVENPELLAAAVCDGQGCLLLPPHMGNWEILSRITHHFPQGHPLGALYRPLNNPYLDARLTGKRRSEGTRMFSKRDNLLEITRFLKGGGIIGVLADQRAGWQGVPANFFGRLTRSSPLPHLLIRRCKIPAFAISVRTLRPGYWALRYHPVGAPRDTQACMDAIELAMRESILDVFWFQDRWKCYLGGEQTPGKWLGGIDQKSARHPHRALLWLVGAGDDWTPPAEWLHPDMNYEFVLDDGQAIPGWVEPANAIHRVRAGEGGGAIRKFLADINLADKLPLDFVAAAQPDDKLRAACRSEGLSFFRIETP